MTTGHSSSPLVLMVSDGTRPADATVGWLRGSGHEVVATPGAAAAIRLLEDRSVAVALCDVPVPDREGLQVVARLRTHSPEVAVILATAVQDVASAVASLRLGVVDYLVKPFGRERLCEAVRRGVEWHRAAVAGRSAQGRLHAEVEQRRARLASALDSLAIDSRAMLEAALRLLSVHEPGLIEHGLRVAELSRAIAARVGLSAPALDCLERGALVHDLSKLIVPSHMTRRGGALQPQDRALVRVGSALGCDVLARVEYLKDAAEIVRARYEWWDGSGYPRGLRGESIPLASRVLAVADTFDTLLQPRRYRAAMGEASAMAEILRHGGTQFDPAVVTALRWSRASAEHPAPAA